MDLQQLRYFVAVAEELHFTRAARRLHLDQGALSKTIRRLEHDLRVRLFVRTTRRVELTAAGIGLLDEARALLAAADHLRTMAGRDHTARHPLLRVGLFLGRTAAAELTEPILATFRSAHPDVRLETVDLDLTDQVEALRARRVDVAVVRLPLGADDLAIHPLFEEPRVVVLPARHALQDAHELDPVDLLGETWFGHGRQPRTFADFYTLGDVWDVTEVRRSSRTVSTLWDNYDALHRGQVVIVVGSSTPRSWPDHPFHVRPLRGVAGSRTAVAHRAGDERSQVAAFVQSARHVVTELVGLVPGARAVSGTSADRVALEVRGE